MKLRTLGLLSASFVVAQLMTMNAMAIINGAYVDETVGSTSLPSSAYKASGGKTNEHQQIAAAIGHSIANQYNLHDAAKQHMGADRGGPYLDSEKAEMQKIASTVRTLHQGQAKVMGKIKDHIASKTSDADPSGNIHQGIAASAAEPNDMVHPESSYDVGKTREKGHAVINAAMSKTRTNNIEILLAAKSHHAHDSNTNDSVDTSAHNEILEVINSMHKVQGDLKQDMIAHFTSRS